MEARRRSLQRLERHRAGDVGDACEATRANERERGHRGHELRAVDEREAFLRREHDRREPGRGECLGAAQQPARRRAPRPSPTSGSARCASGARSPLAPTEPRAGTYGTSPAAEQREQQLDGLDADAGVALRERVRPEQHRGAHDVVGVRLADAAGVAAQQPQLELGRLLGRDRLGDEAPEARVDAVRVVADLGFEKARARAIRSRAARSPSDAGRPLDRDVPDILRSSGRHPSARPRPARGECRPVQTRSDGGRPARGQLVGRATGRGRRRRCRRRSARCAHRGRPTLASRAPPARGSETPWSHATRARSHASCQICAEM